MRKLPMTALRAWSLAALTTLLLGCGSLAPQEGRERSYYLGETRDTALGRAVAGADPRDGTSGHRALADPLEAFAARVLLIRSAERSLDLQYYIWHDDLTGRLLLEELHRAVGRGVRVRLLLDDNGIHGLDAALAALQAHPLAEVRLFNPFPNRRFKALGYLTDFRRLNRRMHNKALIADTQAMIVGGRNIGDTYFGADRTLEFADLDVLVAGPVVADTAAAFDTYWNHRLSYGLEALVPLPAQPARPARPEPPAPEDASVQRYLDAVRQTPLAGQLGGQLGGQLAGPQAGLRMALEWAPTELVVDPPDKADDELEPARLLAARLAAALGRPARELDLVAPYLVPGSVGTEALSRLSREGVRLRLVTNSLAATDVAAVHAGYARRRKDLLRAGVNLHELKADPGASAARPGRDWRWGSSASSLHAKVFTVDRERVFVGSFNLDPRSLRLNTEMGLVIRSPVLARTISEGLDRTLPPGAYALRLAGDGSLQWVEQTADGERVHTTDPQAGAGRRWLVLLLSWLPIEWLL